MEVCKLAHHNMGLTASGCMHRAVVYVVFVTRLSALLHILRNDESLYPSSNFCALMLQLLDVGKATVHAVRLKLSGDLHGHCPLQVLVYFAVAKQGNKPEDGKTDTNPEGLTAAWGLHAEAVASRLHANDLACKVRHVRCAC